ncbi:MAG: hypothetical protein R3Y40_02010 [Eubacteriales bacterium]
MDNSILADKKIFSQKELNSLGFSDYKVRAMVASGVLHKLNKFTYENKHYKGCESDYVYVYAYVPDGVICLLTAAGYYELTTYRPDCIDVAIMRKCKVSTLPDWPDIKLWYFDNERVKIGISEIEECGEKIKISDIEKTVVDIVYYRQKIGIEETKEVLVNYLKRPDRNINKLCRYAEKLKCKEIIETYLEVLL